MKYTLLYRGHKDFNYLASKFRAVSFTENRSLAISYGLGANDSGNPEVANGYLTTVEFHGEIVNASEKGLGNVDQHIYKYSHHEAVRFADGVIGVLKVQNLKNPVTEKAADAK
jgi:hypothetical protein